MYAKTILVALLFLCTIGAFADDIDSGEKVAFDRSKGNCLACHDIPGGESPGNIGPELSNIKQRYPEKSLLRKRIWDETQFNPATVMPPFGKHRILTETEIDQIVEFLYTL